MGLYSTYVKLWAILLATFAWPGSWFIFVSGLSLRPEDVNLILPSIIKQGDDLTMYCHFDSIKFPQIYSVKWYKGNREFFRFTPKEIPPKKSMAFGGIDVDAAQCDLQKVHLRKVPIQMAGNVTCEVTTDTDFRAVEKTKSLTVIVESENPPVLEVLSNNSTTVRQNQRLRIRCTTGASKPAANITFYINDKPYTNPSYYGPPATTAQYIQSATQPFKFVKVQSPNESQGNNGGSSGGVFLSDKDKVSLGLDTKKADIQINLTERYLLDGKIEIKCAATIYNVSQMYSEPFTGKIYEPPKEAIYSSYGNAINGAGKLVWSITETTTPITTWMRTCVCFGKLLLVFPLNILLHQQRLR